MEKSCPVPDARPCRSSSGLASHNSDLGGNEHDFRREESEQIRPALERLLDAYCREGKREVAAASAVTEECERMIASADLLLASDENPALIKEITPWLMQFKLLGEYGREVLCMLAAQCDGKRRNWRKPLLMPRPSRY